jgi:Zn-dependent M28 family amino/carboxypeptidase
LSHKHPPERATVKKRMQRRSVAVLCAAVFLLPLACGKSRPVFDADRAWDHLVAQVDYGPRVPGSAARDSVAHYLTRTLVRYGGEVSTQRFEVKDPYADRVIPMVNVIANFYPDRLERVALAAHYDSRPRADQEEVDSLRTRPVPGANDGASGVAVLLEMARLLGRHDPGIGVDLLFFDGEDYGKEQDLDYYLLGSNYFIAVRPDYRPVCGVLLDMVAGEGSVIAREQLSRTNAPAVTDTLFARAQRLSLEFFRPIDGGPIYDDHVPFLRAGIPMVDLFGYDYAWWHTVEDVPEHCSRDRLGQVGTLMVDFVYDFPF